MPRMSQFDTTQTTAGTEFTVDRVEVAQERLDVRDHVLTLVQSLWRKRVMAAGSRGPKQPEIWGLALR